jgi:hypothetical protein
MISALLLRFAAHPDTVPDVIHGLAERPTKSRRSKAVDNSAATVKELVDKIAPMV